jgi:hypothetical protein
MTTPQAAEDAVKPKKKYEIQIDRVKYEVHQSELTGTQLRELPTPPIGADRDLFEVIPGQPDHKVENAEEVEITNGKRFFTAPAHINPGQPRQASIGLIR